MINRFYVGQLVRCCNVDKSWKIGVVKDLEFNPKILAHGYNYALQWDYVEPLDHQVLFTLSSKAMLNRIDGDRFIYYVECDPVLI